MINLSKNGNWQGGGISYTWEAGGAGFVVVVVAAAVKLDLKIVKKKMCSFNRVFLL